MRHAKILVPALAVAGFWLPQAAHSAPVLCTEPLKPVCLDLDTTYQTPEETERCRLDLNQYASDVKDYVQCLAQAIKADKTDVKSARAEFQKRVAKEN